MDFATAEAKAKELASKGDLKGISDLLARLTKEGMNPVFLQLLGTYTEAAMLHLPSAKKPSR